MLLFLIPLQFDDHRDLVNYETSQEVSKCLVLYDSLNYIDFELLLLGSDLRSDNGHELDPHLNVHHKYDKFQLAGISFLQLNIMGSSVWEV